MRTSPAAVATCLLCSTALAQSINEIRTQQPGVSTQRYVEIAGTPGTSLDGLSFIVVGNDDFGIFPLRSGVIEQVVSLQGKTIPTSGLFVIGDSNYSLSVPDLVAPLAFEVDANKTHMLVRDFVGLVDDDIDVDDDGVIDTTLWSSIVSDVALLATVSTDGVTGDRVYSSTVVGPDGGVFPSHVRKCPDSAEWRIGFADTASGGDTPGTANATCGSGSGVVLINEVRVDQSGADNDEYVELAGQPGASLTGLTFVVLGDATAGKSGPACCRAAKSSAHQSRARSSHNRACCSPTSRPAMSTLPSPGASYGFLSSCIARARRS